MNEWPLLIFTLVLQAAIGGCIALRIYASRLSKVMNEDEVYKLLKPALIALGIMAVLGLLASLLHLGSPLSAPKAILNIGSSWLSREILVTGLFILMMLLTVFSSTKNQKINITLLSVSALVGVADVYAMAFIYISTIIAQWTPENTLVTFYGTTLILGPVIMSTLIVPNLKEEKAIKSVMTPTILLIVASLVIQLVVFTVSSPAVSSIVVDLIRWILAVLGVATVVHALWQSAKEDGKINASLLYLSFAFILISELIGRYLFYTI